MLRPHTLWLFCRNSNEVRYDNVRSLGYRLALARGTDDLLYQICEGTSSEFPIGEARSPDRVRKRHKPPKRRSSNQLDQLTILLVLGFAPGPQ